MQKKHVYVQIQIKLISYNSFKYLELLTDWKSLYVFLKIINILKVVKYLVEQFHLFVKFLGTNITLSWWMK